MAVGVAVCHRLQKPVVLPGMKTIIQGNDFQNLIRWDKVLHQLANRSLDMTIDKIGRDQFNKQYVKFRHAQQLAETICLPVTMFPCSGGGTTNAPSSSKNATHQLGVMHDWRSVTDCLFHDMGCGYMCLDHVATQLGLWGDNDDGDSRMHYKYPKTFGLGWDSRQRLATQLNLTTTDKSLWAEEPPWTTKTYHDHVDLQ